MAKRAPRLRLFDILNAISGIERALVGKSCEDFQASGMHQRAVERWLEIISEASRHVPAEAKDRAPEIPWRAVEDFGNKTRHAYQTISPIRIWQIVMEDLGPLKAACSKLYSEMKTPSDPWPDAEHE